MASCDQDDAHVTDVFLKSHLPDTVENAVALFLEQARYPLAVRSSSLLEDAQHQPFAGLYNTLILPNCHPDGEVRRRQMVRAIKLIYASTYLKRARTYARSTGHRLEQERMAILVQKLTGTEHKGWFYPAITGQASSFNFYPVAHMKAEEGIASSASGSVPPMRPSVMPCDFARPIPSCCPSFRRSTISLKMPSVFFMPSTWIPPGGKWTRIPAP